MTALWLIATALLCVASAQPKVTFQADRVSHGQNVQVSWQGVGQPTLADAIALYTADAKLSESVPLKYKWASSSPSHLNSGAGKTEFRILNQRQDLVFILFSNISRASHFSQAQVLGRSERLRLRNANEPTQGHLALTAAAGEMMVQWVTRDAGRPAVWWGTASGHLISHAPGSNSTFTRVDLCGPPANETGWIEPGIMNQAVMTGLQQGIHYFYKYGDLSMGTSRERSFVMGPPPGPSSTLNVLVTADMGHAETDGSNEWEYDLNARLVQPVGSPPHILSSITNVLRGNGLEQGDSLDVTRRMLASAPSHHLVLMNGDLSYARGFATQWDAFFDQIEELATQLPVMTVEGNHERDQPWSGDRFLDLAWDSGGECGVATYQHFKMPVAEYGKYWYSYDMGPVHFLQISTELDFAAGSEQNRFIENDLRNVNRTRTPWVVVNQHRPIYTSSVSGRDQQSDIVVATDLRNAMEDLFFLFQVDVTFAGHVHLYERTCPVFRKTCVPPEADGSAGAPVHAVVGHGGQWLSYLTNPDTPAYIDVVQVEHGFLQLTANATTLHARMIASVDGHVADDWALHKPLKWKPDLARRTAAMRTFSSHPPHSWLDRIGISFGVLDQVTDLCLKLLEENPSLILDQRNASLVQNMNGREDVGGFIQVLRPFIRLLHSPVVKDDPSLSQDARRALEEILQPVFSRLEASIHGNRSGEIFRRQSSGSQSTSPITRPGHTLTQHDASYL